MTNEVSAGTKVYREVTAITLAPRDNGYRFGQCDNYYCGQFSWLQPVYAPDRSIGAYVCARDCMHFEDIA